MPSGKSKTQTTTQTSGPPAYAAQELQYGVDEARRLYDEGLPSFFPDQTYAGFTPQQEASLRLAEQRAMRGSPLVDTAQNQLQRTLSGDFLGANQYIDPMIDAANRNVIRQFGETVMPSIQSSLGRSGRYGNNAATQNLYENAQRALAQELTDTESSIRGNAYAQERQLMNAAIGQAPSLASQDYMDIAQLGAVGEQRQAMEQAGINEAMQRYQYDNTIDQQALDQFLSRLGGTVPLTGTVGTITQPVKSSSPFSQALGIGASLAGAAFGSPWLGGMIAPTVAAPMQTFGGGAYGGGFSPSSVGPINWYN
jgi:hypothetical protein